MLHPNPWRPFNIHLISRLPWNWNVILMFVSRVLGLPDVAGLAGAGDKTWWALHHPWKRWWPVANVCPGAQPAVPVTLCPSSSCISLWWRWWWGGLRHERPHWESQHPLTTKQETRLFFKRRDCSLPGEWKDMKLQRKCVSIKNITIWTSIAALCQFYCSKSNFVLFYAGVHRTDNHTPLPLLFLFHPLNGSVLFIWKATHSYFMFHLIHPAMF